MHERIELEYSCKLNNQIENHKKLLKYLINSLHMQITIKVASN